MAGQHSLKVPIGVRVPALEPLNYERKRRLTVGQQFRKLPSRGEPTAWVFDSPRFLQPESVGVNCPGTRRGVTEARLPFREEVRVQILADGARRGCGCFAAENTGGKPHIFPRRLLFTTAAWLSGLKRLA